MEKNNNMDELLQLMAQKLGIRVEEAGRLDEGEDKWPPAFEDSKKVQQLQTEMVSGAVE